MAQACSQLRAEVLPVYCGFDTFSFGVFLKPDPANKVRKIAAWLEHLGQAAKFLTEVDVVFVGDSAFEAERKLLDDVQLRQSGLPVKPGVLRLRALPGRRESVCLPSGQPRRS